MTARRQKVKPAKPDESLIYGPMEMHRFGQNVTMQSHMSSAQFAKLQEHLVSEFPKTVAEIDSLVADIAGLVRALPQEELLHRAWWTCVMKHIDIKAEVEIGRDEVNAMRMIDYVQSVIAAVEPAEEVKKLSDELWHSLCEKIGTLFELVNLKYQMCLTAKRRAENLVTNLESEEIFYKALVFWSNCRGQRFQAHQAGYLRDMFLPHSDIIEELFGITGENFVQAFNKIADSLTFGLGRAVDSMCQLMRDAAEDLNTTIDGLRSSESAELQESVRNIIAKNGWESRRDEVSGKIFGTDLFDVQKMTNLPQNLLDDLTWSPGEEKDFFAEGEFRGWPLRIWPIFKRPFIKLNGRYYCFDFYFGDHLYRALQRIILRRAPTYAETWKLKQQEQSEALPIQYLERILPGASVWRGVYYEGRAASGKKEWCEADALLLYDDHLFVIECRGGAFTYTSPANDFPAYIASIQNLIMKPASQGKRFVSYLNSASTVPIYDMEKRQVGELRRCDYRCVTICPITLDPMTELAAKVQHLRKIGLDVGSEPVWALSLDDLRAYADIFGDPLQFLHFVEVRRLAFASESVQLDEELDHLGLYLERNHYSMYADKLRSDPRVRLVFNGYRSEIDKFFHQKLIDPKTPCLLQQKIPKRIREIVQWLSDSKIKGRSRVSSFLLNLSGEGREEIANAIDKEVSQQPITRRPKPMSTHGVVNLTIFCWTRHSMPRKTDQALLHAQATLLINRDPERLLLECSYNDESEVSEINWHWVDSASIPAQLLPSLEREADKLRTLRIERTKKERGKIGRNERCVCGSGKKYKKCCLR